MCTEFKRSVDIKTLCYALHLFREGATWIFKETFVLRVTAALARHWRATFHAPDPSLFMTHIVAGHFVSALGTNTAASQPSHSTMDMIDMTALKPSESEGVDQSLAANGTDRIVPSECFFVLLMNPGLGKLGYSLHTAPRSWCLGGSQGTL